MAILHKGLRTHRPPPVILGSGRTSLIDKFCACMHAFNLESGCAAQLQTYCESIASVTTDLGVEFSLPDIYSANYHDLFPWAVREDPCAGEAGCRESDDLDELPEEGQAQAQHCVTLRGALSIPGLLHVIHNASNSLLNVMQTLDSAVDKLAEVAKLLNTNATCDRLCSSCFAGPLGQQHHERLKSFQGCVYKARWGSVAFCTQAVLGLERVLRWGWSKDAYLAACADAGGQVRNDHIQLDIIDEAINDEYWWACLQTVDHIMAVVRDCLLWAESCPCHFRFHHHCVPAKLRRGWQECPLRGRRLPELAAGDFGNIVRQLLDISGVDILMGLPSSITAAQKATLLWEFELGKAHLTFAFTLKLTAMQEPPRLLHALAHHSTLVARGAMRRCLSCESTHPLIAKLQGELREDAEAYLEGADLQESPSLLDFISSLKFGFSVERQVEGEHAALHHGYSKARRHSEAYDSLLRRLPEIKEVLLLDKGLEQMCTFLDLARSPRRAAAALGMEAHPAQEQATSGWHPMFRRMIYRSDPHTLYGPRPHISQGPSLPPPPVDTEEAQPPGSLVASSGDQPHVSSRGDPPSQGGDVPQDAAPAAAVVAHGAAPAAAELAGAAPDASFAYDDLRKFYALKFLSSALASKADEAAEQRDMYCMPVPTGALKQLRSVLSLAGPKPLADQERPWWDDAGHGQLLPPDGSS